MQAAFLRRTTEKWSYPAELTSNWMTHGPTWQIVQARIVREKKKFIPARWTRGLRFAKKKKALLMCRMAGVQHRFGGQAVYGLFQQKTGRGGTID